jgi:D-sedoheptulose 7-phosphate isomerase
MNRLHQRRRLDRGEDRRRDQTRARLLDSALTMQAIAEQCLDGILAAADRIAGALAGGGKVMWCGNGGSAADCQHLAAELTNRLAPGRDRPALAALALSADACFLTAHANDYGYATVFSRQVEALGKPGDVLVAVSTSGASENVLRAVRAAAAAGLATVGLLGAGGGRAAAEVDLAIVVPSRDVQHIQEGHLAVGHLLVELVERALAPAGAAAAEA